MRGILISLFFPSSSASSFSIILHLHVPFILSSSALSLDSPVLFFSSSAFLPLPPSSSLPLPSSPCCFVAVSQIDEEDEEVWEVLVSSDQNSWKTVAQETLPSSVVRKTSLSTLEHQVKEKLSAETQKVGMANSSNDSLHAVNVTLSFLFD